MLPLVMGVLNVTPDSFSDGGRWFDPDAAIEHGLALLHEGADVIDVGGESTRPGAEPVATAEEARRVIPVVGSLAPHGRVSIDTRRAAVAEEAVEAGATIINDVSASLEHVAAAAGVGWVAMHMRGQPRTMQASPEYADVVGEVASFLTDAARRGEKAGVEEIWIDPGIGFGKTFDHNLALLRGLEALVATGWPVLVGTSRKSFLGWITAEHGDEPVPVDDRLEASLATATWAIDRGARMIRVHDVRATVQAVHLMAAGAPQ